ncbi:MAG: hypothetical protein HY270_00740 [Deltaproteobacteria bacterium]|nr:hypothetical protein [Deltaproteobacteria bacterium]
MRNVCGSNAWFPQGRRWREVFPVVVLAFLVVRLAAGEPLPDLVPDPLIIHDNPFGRACIQRFPTVEACVSNLGAVPAGPFWLSYGFGGAGTHLMDLLHVNGLEAGKGFCQEVWLPNDAPLNIVVDSHSEVPESNEDNNQRYDIIGYATLPPTCTEGPPETPTPTPPPPSPSPTTPEATAIPPLCIGDCNGDSMVTVDELVTGVLMALGNLSPEICAAFCLTECGPGPALRRPDVTCLVRAVNTALGACPYDRCSTDEDCDPGNDCALHRCGATGCFYECLCE